MTGVAEISDFMPVEQKEPTHELVRRAKTVRGEIHFRMVCQPRFDYARSKHRVEKRDGEVLFVSEGKDRLALRLRTSIPVTISDGAAIAEFTLQAGQSAAFVLEQARPGQESASAGPDHVPDSFKRNPELLAELDCAFHLPRPLARNGQPFGSDVETFGFSTSRFDGGRSHVWSS